MPQTPQYNFDEDGVTADAVQLHNVHKNGDSEIKVIRARVQPLKDGGWIGKAADAFYQADDDFVKTFEALNDDILRLESTVRQASDATMDTVGQIDAVIDR